MISCMGGWCSKRETCQQYLWPADVIVERLCEANEYDAYIKCIENLSYETQPAGKPLSQSSKATPKPVRTKAVRSG